MRPQSSNERRAGIISLTLDISYLPRKMKDELAFLLRTTDSLDIADCLCAAALCFMLLFPFCLARASNRAGDEFLTGYIASILERELHWERDSYILKIVNGVATITMFKDEPMRQEAADKRLRSIDGLQGITIVVKPADVRKPGALSRLMGITGQGEAFPMGDLFQPIIADPKQPQFFVSFLQLQIIGCAIHNGVSRLRRDIRHVQVLR